MNRVVASCIGAALVVAFIAGNWAVAAHPSTGVLGKTPQDDTPVCCVAGSEGDHGVAAAHILTLEGARRVSDAASAAARARGAGGAIAIVDAGGNAVLVERLDGTFPAAASVSLGKARTAALFRKPTKAFEDAINGGRTALAAVAEMTPLQGGIPIMHEGYVVGAIGVSGAHSQDEDEQIALAGAAVISGTPSSPDK